MKSPSNQTCTPLLRTLHLFTLCSFAFTQPLLTALEKQSVYLHDQKFTWIDFGVLLLLLMFVLPMIWVAVDWTIQRCICRSHDWCRNTVLIILIFLTLSSFTRPYISDWWLVTGGSSGLIVFAVLFPCSLFLGWLYETQPLLRSWLTVTSVGIVVFPGMFLWEMHRIQLDETSVKGRIEVKNPVPVVMIVFDEFCGITLMNERSEIDAARFPEFARLAGISTWYRNTTTVSPRTDIAVPAILSGRYPETSLPPLAASYPGNLFQLIEATRAFEMKVFEPVSRLCPRSIEIERAPERPRLVKLRELIHILAAIYPRLIFTSDTPVWFPAIPKSWFGVRLNFIAGSHENSTAGGFHYPGTEYRSEQQIHVLNVLKPTEQPEFCFFHTVLPHYPWTFLPTGEQYQSEFSVLRIPAGARGELGEDWDDDPATVLRNEFRYRLQVGYVDRFIGQLLDRLEATGMLDRCLLIVTADHGVSFRPGHSRRLPDAETLPEIFSVPLFIKYPGQTTGRTDDRNVETIDILPTIAEVLGMKLPDPVDGIPLSADLRRPRKTLYFENTMTVAAPDFPQRTSAMQRQFAQFGNENLDQLPLAVSSHPDWHERRITDFLVDERTIPAELFDVHRLEEGEVTLKTELVPRLIACSLAAEDLPQVPAEIVLAVDGIIRDTGKSFWIRDNKHGFEFLIPKSIIEGPIGVVELYLVDRTTPDLRLRPLKITKPQPQTF